MVYASRTIIPRRRLVGTLWRLRYPTIPNCDPVKGIAQRCISLVRIPRTSLVELNIIGIDPRIGDHYIYVGAVHNHCLFGYIIGAWPCREKIESSSRRILNTKVARLSAHTSWDRGGRRTRSNPPRRSHSVRGIQY